MPEPIHHPDAWPGAGRSERTRELFAQLAAAPSAECRAEIRRQVVTLNLRVAHGIAARYRGRGVDQDDLEQAAACGLVKAAANFDPGRMKDFLTYAVPTMRGEVQHYFRDMGWTVRPPRRIQELQWQLNTSIDRLIGVLGREPTQGEVLDDLSISYTEYAETVAAFGAFRPSSLTQPISDPGPGDGGVLLLGDCLSDPGDLEALERHLVLEPVLARLSPQEIRMLRRRFVDGWTQQEIGAELGVGQAQVSRWLSGIFQRLSRELDDVRHLLAG